MSTKNTRTQKANRRIAKMQKQRTAATEKKPTLQNKIEQKDADLRTGLSQLKEERENLEKYLAELNERILRTEGARSVLAMILQEEKESAGDTAAPPVPVVEVESESEITDDAELVR